MARGKPDLNGAPKSSGTARPGSNYTNTQGPGRFKGNSKHTAASSGDTRSSGPSHRQPIARERQAGEGIAPDLSSAWKMNGDKGIGGAPPTARSKSSRAGSVKQNELGNAHGGKPIADAPPLAR